MISVDEALKIILDATETLPAQSIPIKSCTGKILAEDVIAEENVPPFDNSAMDGYAVIASDVNTASREHPVSLQVIDIVQAGKVSDKKLNLGQTIQIMTGAPIPTNADAVVMAEQTEKTPDGKVKIFAPVLKNESLRFAGNDIKKGSVVFQKGRLLKPYDTGVLASIGRPVVRITPKPRIAILSTGDELSEIDRPLSPGKIRNSNNYVLQALIGQMGAETIDLGIAQDTQKDTNIKLQKAFSADIIITSGGVSMGEFDFVRDTLKNIGVDIKFWKVKQKPGKPLVFGNHEKKLFFGLPGNPVSSVVCFELFVVPAIKKMSGMTDLEPCQIKAESEELIKKKPGLRHFLRGIVRKENNRLRVTTTQNQSSGAMSSLSAANCLIDLPEEKEDVLPGEIVSIILLDTGIFEKWYCG